MVCILHPEELSDLRDMRRVPVRPAPALVTAMDESAIEDEAVQDGGTTSEELARGLKANTSTILSIPPSLQKSIQDKEYRAIEDEAVQDRGTSSELARGLKANKSTILRFPPNFRKFAEDKEYRAPSTVALGPYHRDLDQVKAMEQIKLKAVRYFFEALGIESLEATTRRQLNHSASEARACYADGDALQGISDLEFGNMMFVDGCFLVQVMECVLRTNGETSCPLTTLIQPHFVGIMRDIMMLENQIPWPVVKLLKDLKGISMEQLFRFFTLCLHGSRSQESVDEDLSAVENYAASHLLDLTQFCVARRRKPYSFREAGLSSIKTLTLSTSAEELAEMGIELRASAPTTLFSDMSIVKGLFFAQLSLSPLRMDTISACWFVNMAAFETSRPGNLQINSYLAVIKTLMSRVEDVRELRIKGIVQGFSDQHNLEFFNSLALHLLVDHAYDKVFEEIEVYKHKRWLRIALYKFLCKNAKTIATVLSIIGVLVGIFKALLSLKQHPT
ncbi:unnamed protein product [Urochloa humidicola]